MITKRLNHNNKNHYKGVNKKLYITIHQTGNTSKGTNAINHARYIENGSTTTWHYTVDEQNIVQHFNDDVQCWHAGDGRGNGNLNSIGIELCINSDGDYTGTIKNSVNLVKYLMNKYNIPIEKVVQHNRWSGKNCPMQIRQGKNGINWNDYINMIKGNTQPVDKIVDNSTDDYITIFAKEVIKGRYGNGNERKERIYNTVQNRVNELLNK